MTTKPPNLLGLPKPELLDTLREHFRRRGQPEYRAGQVQEWILRRDAMSFSGMTNLPGGERESLRQAFRLLEPKLDTTSISSDGTVKHLWAMEGGEVVESVLIPARDRLTLCISSQAGCALRCQFCATGWSGFRRQLSPAEIVGQYRASARWAKAHGRGAVTNLVFMGMGEPLANRHHVLRALSILNHGYKIGARRITISTVGVIPGIEELSRRPEQFRVALSLHAPESQLRERLIPLEKRYPLDKVMESLERLNARGGRRITFEYTMIRDINDDPRLIPPLTALACRVQAFVNLIPFNPIPFVDWQPSPWARVRAFRDGLRSSNVPVAVREPRGRDIDAACGQLRATSLGHRARPAKGAEAT